MKVERNKQDLLEFMHEEDISNSDNTKESAIMAENIELTAQELAENELLNDAIVYAAVMHRSALRKGTSMPYIVHPDRKSVV